MRVPKTKLTKIEKTIKIPRTTKIAKILKKTGKTNDSFSDMGTDVFEELNKNGHTVIIVTHDNGVAARCQRVIEIKDGEVLSE